MKLIPGFTIKNRVILPYIQTHDTKGKAQGIYYYDLISEMIYPHVTTQLSGQSDKRQR